MHELQFHKLKKLCQIAKIIRDEQKNISFKKFLNLYKNAQELQCINHSIKLHQNSAHIAILQEYFEEYFYNHYNLTLNLSQLDIGNVSFQSTVSLVQNTKKLIADGYIVVCDSLELWQMLQITTSHSLQSYSAFKKIYRLFQELSSITILDCLRDKFLFNQEYCNLELQVRKNEQKNIQDIKSILPNDLSKFLEYKTTKFSEFYKKILDIFDQSTRIALEQYNQLIPLIEYEKNLEWSNGLIAIAFSVPNIIWGIENALRFSPSQVLLCLAQEDLADPLCSMHIENATEIRSTLLKKWKEKIVNIYTVLPKVNDNHPFYQVPNNNIKKKKYIHENNKIQANPDTHNRPAIISATAFNQLMQDPYGFYAKYILDLKFLEPAQSRITSRDFGNFIHKAVENFLKNTPCINTDNNLNLAFNIRLNRILKWIKNQLLELGVEKIFSEQEYATEIKSKNRIIRIKARIDAVIKTHRGNLIVNFKTGTPPTKNEVISGYHPQLAIEMYVARESLSEYFQGEFWYLKGTAIAGTNYNIPISNEYLSNNIFKILNDYLVKSTPFLACPWPTRIPKYNNYQHLERIEN